VRLFPRIFAAGVFAGVAASTLWAAPARPMGQSVMPSPYVTNTEGSTFVPMDSWMYPALDRLHSLGYLDTAFMGIRPWTRLQIAQMLEETAQRLALNGDKDTQAIEIYEALWNTVEPDVEHPTTLTQPSTELDSAYQQFRGIGGTPLRDSYHLGQTIINDYGRPYESGFNDYTGFSTRSEAGRWTLYFRGEYQHAPSAAGYSESLASYLSNTVDSIPYDPNIRYDTIPAGPIPAANDFRILEANVGFHWIGNEFSLGKMDHWLGPDQGASMSWSNNAEDIYAFQINDVDPFRIPLVSRITGPFRYEFFVGSLKGHTDPNSPWVHMEKLSFKPTRNLEMGFARTVIWGGAGHEPVTLGTFWQSFKSFQNVYGTKLTNKDPGARFSNFDFNYRLPFLRKWVTLYADSLVHDDVSPVDSPRRAAIAPGIYLSHFPGLPKLDLRVEADSTDPVSNHVQSGQFMEYETVQRQGNTNKGFVYGDWIGRENKGGQAWVTYHLSPEEDVQFMYRRDKASKAFFEGGSTQNDFKFSVVKRIHRDIEVRGYLQYEDWKIPIYKPGQQSDTTGMVQITWIPRYKKLF